eukprot:gnl/Chilomastix_cuspidata/2551.p1 GENE.gnl/Chilomastix_cuspidata/2551~~gnl/Chilomastix_cuspidata/2551.p1  ORF type:complete len:199 (+),score=38.98 gnl/Chilomastix_cuspidata/2551:22-597(+)
MQSKLKNKLGIGKHEEGYQNLSKLVNDIQKQYGHAILELQQQNDSLSARVSKLEAEIAELRYGSRSAKESELAPPPQPSVSQTPVEDAPKPLSASPTTSTAPSGAPEPASAGGNILLGMMVGESVAAPVPVDPSSLLLTGAVTFDGTATSATDNSAPADWDATRAVDSTPRPEQKAPSPPATNALDSIFDF